MEFNVLMGNHWIPQDAKLIFGEPIERCLMFNANLRWNQLLKELGLYPSSSKAFRDGFVGEIPEGYSERMVGKKKNEVYVFKCAVPSECIVYEGVNRGRFKTDAELEVEFAPKVNLTRPHSKTKAQT